MKHRNGWIKEKAKLASTYNFGNIPSNPQKDTENMFRDSLNHTSLLSKFFCQFLISFISADKGVGNEMKTDHSF